MTHQELTKATSETAMEMLHLMYVDCLAWCGITWPVWAVSCDWGCLCTVGGADRVAGGADLAVAGLLMNVCTRPSHGDPATCNIVLLLKD